MQQGKLISDFTRRTWWRRGLRDAFQAIQFMKHKDYALTNLSDQNLFFKVEKEPIGRCMVRVKWIS